MLEAHRCLSAVGLMPVTSRARSRAKDKLTAALRAVVMSKMDKARRLRAHALKELRDSEKSYLAGLREMESTYRAQIRADLGDTQ